jgi:holin-like protein
MQPLALILAFGFAGEVFRLFMPFSLPSSVIGMVLMLIALGTRLLNEKHLGATADFLSANMAFFFLPAAVTILENLDLILPVIWQLLIIVVTAALLTFFAVYGTVRLFQHILGRMSKAR